MKQGTNSVLKVNINYSFDSIEKIQFLFKQNNTKLMFTYPSTTAIRVEDENAVNLIWSAENTFLFDSKKAIQMDTLISITDAESNPETSIATFYMSPTLFEKEDID